MFTFVRSKNQSRWIDLLISCSGAGLYSFVGCVSCFISFLYWTHLQSADVPIYLWMSPDRLILLMQDSGVDECRSKGSGRNLMFTLVWYRESRRPKSHHSPLPGCRSRQVARPEPSPRPVTSRTRRDEGSSSAISRLIAVLTAGSVSVSFPRQQ